jgi:Asp-tRNA(Asn)/Glu-tRNA(Gln) amidotransferase A subunit family amidase
VAGLHATCGNPEWKDYVADWDTTVVQRRVIIIGKINVPFMLADFGADS